MKISKKIIKNKNNLIKFIIIFIIICILIYIIYLLYNKQNENFAYRHTTENNNEINIFVY